MDSVSFITVVFIVALCSIDTKYIDNHFPSEFLIVGYLCHCVIVLFVCVLWIRVSCAIIVGGNF